MIAQSQSAGKSRWSVPGPRGHWLLGNLRQFSADPVGMMQLTATYGRVARMRFLHSTAWLISHPDDIKHVLVDNHRAYHKGQGLRALKPTLGEGLLTSEDEFHQRQRRLIQPAFHRQRIESYAEVMTAYTAAQMAQWLAGAQIDLHEEMMHLTMVIVAKCLFDADVSGNAGSLGHAISDLILAFDYNRVGPIGQFIDKFDVARTRARKRNLAVVDGMLYDLIRKRRADPADRGDLLSMILAAVDNEGDQGHATGMSDKQARDELFTLFTAGHETTAIALTWCFYLLSQNPHVEERLLRELDEVLGSPAAGRSPTPADLPRLPYARRVFAESMRMYPPAWVTARIAVAEDEIDGVRIRKGDGVVVSPYITQHDPAWWPDPERFDPDRFTEQEEAKRPKYAYFPFGGGPRRCIGEPFAWMEGHLILASVAHRYHLRVAADYVPALQPKITLRPAHGLPVTLEARV